MKDILFITVNYKDTTVTENFVNSLQQLDFSDKSELVIVDSESTVETQKQLEFLGKKYSILTRVIYSKDNSFYWGGVSRALEVLNLSYTGPPYWIIVCNNDILFPQKNFLVKLNQLNTAQYPVIAPSIFSSATGKNLNPFMVKPIESLEKIYYAVLYLNQVTAKLIFLSRKWFKQQRDKFIKPPPPIMRKIYAPHGAFIIFSNVFFQRGGWIDSNFQMYGEEVTTAEIAKRYAIPIFFLPELEVLHIVHSNAGNHPWKKWFVASKAAYNYLKKEYL